MAVTTLVGRSVSTGGGIAVDVEGDRITGISDCAVDPGAPWIVPGFVDLQVNGFAGHDVNAVMPDAEAIGEITRELGARGVTTWVPTVITGTEAQICARLDAVTAAVQSDPVVAAAVPFVHVEGPFLSEFDGPRGVHDRSAVRPIDASEVARWATHGRIGYVTLSPHDDATHEQIAEIVASGIAVAVGHTHAGPDQIRRAVDAGATLSTHLGNGIFSELPRHPNAIWAQLAEDRLRCGLIGDGHHLPADAFTAMARALGPDRAFLVSDAVELAGAAPGRYRTPVGGEVELTPDGKLEYSDTGLLAGSAASLADCVEWVTTATPIGLAGAVMMATRVPGMIIRELTGGAHDAGRIVPGARADLVFLDDFGRAIETFRGTDG
ncbi:N-acetylglucosamine-6-phosphate deacetylase [Microbacterium murale]|uniref:N-acetylglucosamine-6-phosphate deacetylase n=1 Tax=Microbacterium murale TaxID=1081040 RepID=A0ABU0P8Q2_9MICO|nr:N-acetylglucosamine-6-phosphate deacetylase [Microbacterium murale]MDQ0643715.1 N-acetylglucosamine-6-phosphate deacetylase [Microbacterium murale]